MFDAKAANLEVRQRGRAQVAELRHDDTAEDLDEGILRSCSTPALFVYVRRVSAAELTPGMQTQRVELDVVVGVVVQSGASRGAPAQSLAEIAGKVEKAFHWWKPAWALERLKFRGEDEPVRDGSRLGVQLHFAASVYERYT